MSKAFRPRVDSDLLFAEGTFSRIARGYGKSTRELQSAVRQSTTIFIHYVIDYALQQRQGDDDQRAVALKPIDIARAIQELGFDGIARRLKNPQK